MRYSLQVEHEFDWCSWPNKRITPLKFGHVKTTDTVVERVAVRNGCTLSVIRGETKQLMTSHTYRRAAYLGQVLRTRRRSSDESSCPAIGLQHPADKTLEHTATKKAAAAPTVTCSSTDRRLNVRLCWLRSLSNVLCGRIRWITFQQPDHAVCFPDEAQTLVEVSAETRMTTV